MRITNYWLQRSKEQLLLKIVEWAQKNKKQIESLSRKDIGEALRNHRKYF